LISLAIGLAAYAPKRDRSGLMRPKHSGLPDWERRAEVKLGQIQTRVWVRLRKTSNRVEANTLVAYSGKKFDVTRMTKRNHHRPAGVTETSLKPGEEGWIIVQGPANVKALGGK